MASMMNKGNKLAMFQQRLMAMAHESKQFRLEDVHHQNENQPIAMQLGWDQAIYEQRELDNAIDGSEVES